MERTRTTSRIPVASRRAAIAALLLAVAPALALGAIVTVATASRATAAESDAPAASPGATVDAPRDAGRAAARDAGGSGAATTGDAEATGRAIFAAGCFWCVEAAFDAVPGVVRTTSGFVGGRMEHPTYEQVSAGGTGHAEAVEVIFDPRRTDYRQLLDVFWHNVDPLTAGRQFCDVGDQYRGAIFWLDEDQRRAAVASKEALEREGRLRGRIVTEIVPAGRFWPAEEYHQDYHRKNPARYRYYRWSCGRDERLREVWGDSAPH